MQFRDFLIETQTISQYIKNQRELPPELYKQVKDKIRQQLTAGMPTLGANIDRYVNWLTYWAVMDFFHNRPQSAAWRQYLQTNMTTKQINTTSKLKLPQGPSNLGEFVDKISWAANGILRREGIRDFILAHIADNNIQSKFNTVEYSPEQAEEDSKDWHYQLSLKQAKPGGPGRLLLNLDRLGPQWRGWRWLTLGRGYCKQEGDAAGHCGNVGEKPGDNIYSLRDPENRVHLTFIINNGVLGEMKGRANNKPSPKYHPAIIELLRSKNVGSIMGGGYAPENNFELDDLPEETQQQLLKKKPYLNNPLKYVIQNDKNDKELVEKINDFIEEGQLEKVITAKNGQKIAVLEKFENYEDLEEGMKSYGNAKIENIGWLDDPWAVLSDTDSGRISDYLDNLTAENAELLEKYVDKALEDHYGWKKAVKTDLPNLIDDEEDEDFSEMDLAEKLEKEDGEVESAVRSAISSGIEVGTEEAAFKDVQRQLTNSDNNGFYFSFWEDGEEGMQLRIDLVDLEKLLQKGKTNIKDEVEVDYSQPYNGYYDFSDDAFNERLPELLADTKIDIEEEATKEHIMIGFQDWMQLREGLGKWNASKKRHEPITKYKGSWAHEEEERKKSAADEREKRLEKKAKAMGIDEQFKRNYFAAINKKKKKK